MEAGSGAAKVMNDSHVAIGEPWSRGLDRPIPRPVERDLQRRSARLAVAGLITVAEFAELACLSRRQIDRLRKRRPDGFPREFELGTGSSKHRSCPRFRLVDVNRWLESRALW